MASDPFQRKAAHIKVWCLADEKAAIQAKAQAAGLSDSRYLRDVGLGTPIRGVLDQQAVVTLARISAQQDRLCALLTAHLRNDARWRGRDDVLERIANVQESLLQAAQAVRKF